MKSTNRRHRNPEIQEINKKPFFSRVSDNSRKSKKGKQAFFQAKLRISKKDDKEEKEADIAAKYLVNRASMESPEEKDNKIRKQAKPEEEEELQAKLNIQKLKEPEEEEPIQAKLIIQKQQQPEEEEKIQTKLIIQEQTEAKDKEERIQSKSENKNEVSNPPLSENIENTKGRGIHLPPEIRTEMEAFFKADFSNVCIHIDQTAVCMCRKLNARAFTNGLDIYFNAGQYNPTTSEGKKLLAHELSHVVQQIG